MSTQERIRSIHDQVYANVFAGEYMRQRAMPLPLGRTPKDAAQAAHFEALSAADEAVSRLAIESSGFE